jgi:membrane protease YdiL (CAAX protease family)
MKHRKNRPLLDLTELALLAALMACLMCCDPFRIGHRLIDWARLRFPIFVREPRLLFYSYIYIGSFIAKASAIILIAALLASKRTDILARLGMRPPKAGVWRRYLIPFVLFAAAVRIYLFNNPVVPNLPIRFVFPEAMMIGNALIIFSSLVIAPVIEELIFRGYMYDVLERGFGALFSVFATSVLFMLAHAPQLEGEPFGLGLILSLGLLLGTMRRKSGSVLVPIFYHGVYNLVFIAVGVINFVLAGY